MIKGTLRALCIFVAATSWGCAALPDVTPFVAATTELRRSMKTGFGAVRDELTTMAKLTSDAKKRAEREGAKDGAEQLGELSIGYRELAARVDKVRATRAAALDGFRDYASAIAGIVAAGNQGRESVNAVADSVNGLIGVFGGPVMSGTIKNLAAAIGGEIIRWQAMTSLEEALDAADPPVQKLAQVLVKGAGNLADTLVTKPEAVWAALTFGNEQALKYREKLVAERDRLSKAVAALGAGTSPDEATLADLERIGTLLEQTESWYAPIRDGAAGAKARAARGEGFWKTTDKAIRAWAKAHADIVKAVKERKPYDLNRLIDLTIELKGYVEELKK